MKQKFIVELTFRDGKVMWIASNKGLIDDITKAYHFQFVPPFRKTYNRFKPKKITYVEVD